MTYNDELHGRLLTTLESVCGPSTVVYLAHQRRPVAAGAEDAEQLFVSRARQRGFEVDGPKVIQMLESLAKVGPRIDQPVTLLRLSKKLARRSA